MWEVLLVLMGAYAIATCIMWTLAALLPSPEYTDPESIELLGDLVSHIDCAMTERDATDVFCQGCYGSLKVAREWLEKNDPTWTERRTTRMDHDGD